MQTDHLWSKTCALFRADVSADAADRWLSQLTPVGLDERGLAITGPERARDWVELRYAKALRTCATRAFGSPLAISFSDQPTSDGAAVHLNVAPSAAAAVGAGIDSTELNGRYSFERFVIGGSNQVAHAAALAVAERPSLAFNPLFIYGQPGVGKTHLLHSIGNYLARVEPQLGVKYMTAENFATLFLRVLKHRSIGEFKERLRSVDVLLVDDVQFLQNKTKTVEEFFHTFNALHESGRQLVITSDRTPRELSELEDRLRERFEAGLVVEIQPPDKRLRSAILRQRVHAERLPIEDPRVIGRIAEWVPANVRSLEGALVRVSAFASLRGKPVTPELVDEMLQALHPRAPRTTTRPTINQVIAAVAADAELEVDELLAASRVRKVAVPRQHAMYLCCDLTGETLPMIAKAFRRDHSTVIHARDKVANSIATDPGTAASVDRLRDVVDRFIVELTTVELAHPRSTDRPTIDLGATPSIVHVERD